jgi:hypothetical protein
VRRTVAFRVQVQQVGAQAAGRAVGLRSLAAAVVLAAACSGGGRTPPPTPTTLPPTAPLSVPYAVDPRAPVTWRVDPTGDPATDEVLATYRHFVFVIHRVAAKPDPTDAELLALTHGDARAFYTRQYAGNARAHVIQIGPATVTSAVVRHTGATVTITSCQDLTQSYVYDNGRRDAEPVGYYRETAVMRKIGAAWVADRVTGELKAC